MTDPAGLARTLVEGDHAALSRAISWVENQSPGFDQLLRELFPRTGRGHRIGVTGPPGAGKSTLTQALARAWRTAGHTVGVVAVDPTSPVSGGALLGDRIRMTGVALDPGVYIRSMATRGALGGLALSTREVCDVLDAAGFDRILVETVGVGQAELDVVAAADTVVLVLTPESGDGIQTLKAGLMEVADIFVVNKADRPLADRLAREIEAALQMRHPETREVGPVLLTVATDGSGVSALVEAVDRHRAGLAQSGELLARRRRRLAEQTRRVVERTVLQWAGPALVDGAVEEGRLEVESGQATPYDIAERVLQRLRR
jgi:LAO/AO transport system kinase